MTKLMTMALLTITVYGNQKITVEQGFTVHQMLCKPGEHHMVKNNTRFDKKTGKYVSTGRPIEKCVKVDEKKLKK